MSETVDWGREIEETEFAFSAYLKNIIDRPNEIKIEKRGISEVAVIKGLPLGITLMIGKYIGMRQNKFYEQKE